jgi:hypothetical protein
MKFGKEKDVSGAQAEFGAMPQPSKTVDYGVF